MTGIGWTKRLKGVAALGAVAVLLVHALVMGWHLPPQLRALAGLEPGFCHAAGPDSDSPGHSPSPSDHLAHCPFCLSVDGKALGPVGGPVVAPPLRVAVADRPPLESIPVATASTIGFSARAPPAAV